MQTFTTLLALTTLATAFPTNQLVTRATCGSAPAGTGSQTPLSQPTGIQTAQACQTSCTANTQCQSFVFGMVDNTIKCMLFSVAASQVPSQGSSNLVAFDKACTSVPAVKPTTANPTGANTSNSNSNTNTGAQQGTTGAQQGTTGAQQGTTGTQQGTAGNANTGNTNTQGQQASKPAKRDTCAATPTGSNQNTAPLSQPANIKSSADCKKQCQANASCKSFTFGANECKLFSVAASAVPAPTNGQSAQVFDVGCAI